MRILQDQVRENDLVRVSHAACTGPVGETFGSGRGFRTQPGTTTVPYAIRFLIVYYCMVTLILYQSMLFIDELPCQAIPYGSCRRFDWLDNAGCWIGWERQKEVSFARGFLDSLPSDPLQSDCELSFYDWQLLGLTSPTDRNRLADFRIPV